MQGLEDTKRPVLMADGKTELLDMVFFYEPNATAKPQWAKKIKNLDLWISAPLVIIFLVLVLLNYDKKTGWHWVYPTESWQFTIQLLLFFAVGLAAKWCIKNYQLTITADAIGAHLPIPWRWGQSVVKLLRINWSTSFKDIDRVELYIPKLAFANLQQVQLGLVVRHGTNITFRPALWVHPDQEPLPRIQAKHWLMKPIGDLWRSKETPAPISLEAAAKNLPLVTALRARGVPTPTLHIGFPPNKDLLASRSVRGLLTVALATAIIGIFVFISLTGQHLFTSLPWQAYIPSVLLAMMGGAVFVICMRKEAITPPISHSIAAFAVWLLALALTSPGAIQGLATAGRPASTQTFAMYAGKAVAIKPTTPTPDIALPTTQRSIKALSNGAHLDIEVIEGRWGIWIYDDEALRQAADNQSE